jgi:prevent-host-death family protein
MKFLSSAEARKNFADTLNRVTYGSEHIAIKRSGKEFVYMISAQDYELFQQLLEQAEDQSDLEVAESRMNDPKQETISFDDFFADLED